MIKVCFLFFIFLYNIQLFGKEDPANLLSDFKENQFKLINLFYNAWYTRNLIELTDSNEYYRCKKDRNDCRDLEHLYFKKTDLTVPKRMMDRSTLLTDRLRNYYRGSFKFDEAYKRMMVAQNTSDPRIDNNIVQSMEKCGIGSDQKNEIICIIKQEYVEAVTYNLIENTKRKSIINTFVNEIEKIDLKLVDTASVCKKNPSTRVYDEKLDREVKNIIVFMHREKEKKSSTIKKTYPYSKFFKIEVVGTNGQKRLCTMTYFKYKDKCHSVTNEHCVSEINNLLTWVFPEAKDDIKPVNAGAYEFSIKTVDKENELVLFNTPDIFNLRYCGKIANIRNIPVSELVKYRSERLAIGYTSGKHIDYKNNLHSTEEMLQNVLPKGRLIKTALKNVDNFVEYRLLDVGPGMSGGGVINSKAELLGITTRYIPYQDTLWIIPIGEVIEFINGKEEILTKNLKLYSTSSFTSKARSHTSGDNTSSMPGDNTASMPGDNTASMPGDNTASMPGDNTASMPSTDLELKRRKELKKFMDNHEGIADFNDSKKRNLLGVRCNGKAWEQIDGFDDYIYKCDDLLKLSSQDKIYSDKDGFVPKEYRGQLLLNLTGKYNYSKSDYFGRVLTMKPNNSTIDGMEKLDSINQYDEIKITNDSINLHFGKKKEIKFKIKYVNNKKKIVLISNKGDRLVCENKSLNKLICKGENIALSLSMINTLKKQLGYKYSTRNDNGTYQYHYGEFINR